MSIRLQINPLGITLDGFLQNIQLLIACLVVTNIAIVNLAMLIGSRILDQQRNGNRRSGAGIENLATLATRLFTLSALITTQVVNVN